MSLSASQSRSRAVPPSPTPPSLAIEIVSRGPDCRMNIVIHSYVEEYEEAKPDHDYSYSNAVNIFLLTDECTYTHT